MSIFANILTGAAGFAMIAGVAAPAAAQTAPYGGYQAPYNNQGGIGGIIGQILGGGRYGAYGQGNDRVAVDQCARAAEARVSQSNRAPGYGSHPQNYQGYGYNHVAQARVIGITSVERRQTGLRVSGVIDSGRNQHRAYGNQGYGHGGQPYPNQGYGYGGQGYPNQGYPNQYGHPGNAYAYGQPAQVADLRFTCRVDFRGYVTALDIKRNAPVRRGY